MKLYAVVVAMVLMASLAQAEEKPRLDWKPFAVLAAGQSLDVVTTRIAFGRGCVEGNPLLRAEQPSTGRLVATKVVMVGTTATVAVVMAKSGHQTIARWLGYGGGATGFGVSVWNLSVSCR